MRRLDALRSRGSNPQPPRPPPEPHAAPRGSGEQRGSEGRQTGRVCWFDKRGAPGRRGGGPPGSGGFEVSVRLIPGTPSSVPDGRPARQTQAKPRWVT